MDGDGRCHLYLSHSLSLSLSLSLSHSLSLPLSPWKVFKSTPDFCFVRLSCRDNIFITTFPVTDSETATRSVGVGDGPDLGWKKNVPGSVSTKSLIIWEAEQHRGSILASHPATPGSNPCTVVIFSLYCLVCDQYWDPYHLVLSNGFHNCS